MRKKRFENAYLLTKNLSEERDFPEGKIISVPAWQIEDLKEVISDPLKY